MVHMKHSIKNLIQLAVWGWLCISILISAACSPPQFSPRSEQSPENSSVSVQPKPVEQPKRDSTLPALFVLDDAQQAARRVWRSFIKDGRYSIALAEDFKMPEWTKTVYYSSDIDNSIKHPYGDGDINRDGVIDDIAFIVVDNTRKDADKFSIVIFNLRKDRKSYDGPFWLFRDSDLSTTRLGRSSGGPMHVTQYREDGTYRFCYIKWNRQLKEYSCEDVR